MEVKRTNTLILDFGNVRNKPSNIKIHRWIKEKFEFNQDQLICIQVEHSRSLVYIKLISDLLVKQTLKKYETEKLLYTEQNQEYEIYICENTDDIWVKIHNLPPEISILKIAEYFSKYGVIKTINNEMWSGEGLYHIENGVRSMLISMKKKIPPYVTIEGVRSLVTYKNQKRKKKDCTAKPQYENVLQHIAEISNEETATGSVNYIPFENSEAILGNKNTNNATGKTRNISKITVHQPQMQQTENEITHQNEKITVTQKDNTILKSFQAESRPKTKSEKKRKHKTKSTTTTSSSAASTEPKTCNKCKEQIKGGVLTALGQTWHPDHFCCNECKEPITETKFHTNDNSPYCTPCHIKLFAPTCHACDQPILDKCVQAMGVNWHEDHFVCEDCKTKLIGQQFMDVAGVPRCQKCYLAKHADKCKGCGKAIPDKAIVALDAKWHQMCFRCSKCSKPIMKDQSFQVDSGKPHCVKC